MMDRDLTDRIDAFVNENYDRIFNDIARLVAINSVQGEPEENAPFGAAPKAALDKALEISRELGLDTRDCEGMMGYAATGEGERYLATITHLDVVPTGEGWSADPFVMREREGYILGRGVMDDKGPSVLCLYALKFLKDSGLAERYPVRALLGINEETGMADLNYYLEKYPAPLFCFSPDANFPMCNGEKGIFGGSFISAQKAERIKDIKGGFATNAIPDKAEARVEADKLESKGRVRAERDGALWRLTASGIGGHASLPEGSVNAIGVLADYLLENDVCEGGEREFLELLSRLLGDWSGEALGIAAEDEKFGKLTVVGGVIDMTDGRIRQSLDSRYPACTSGEKIAAGLRRAAGDTAELICDRDIVPFFIPADSPALKACIGAYSSVTGESAKPYTIGGATYARHFPNAVSFGPEHPERPAPAFAGPIHGVDEAANKQWFTEALKIYILALTELEKLEF